MESISNKQHIIIINILPTIFDTGKVSFDSCSEEKLLPLN